MIVYSVASKQSFEMARIIRDKILNHLVRLPMFPLYTLKRYLVECAPMQKR